MSDIDKVLCDLHDLGFHGDSLEHLEKLADYIEQSNKAYLLSVLPEKKVMYAPNFIPKEDDVTKWGFNKAIDTIKKNVGIENV